MVVMVTTGGRWWEGSGPGAGFGRIGPGLQVNWAWWGGYSTKQAQGAKAIKKVSRNDQICYGRVWAEYGVR